VNGIIAALSVPAASFQYLTALSVTRWNARSDGEAVLATYFQDPKIARVTELLGQVPTGFLGDRDGLTSELS
jgi:hypothetical protein